MVRSGIGQRSYSANPADYRRLEEVGNGASATVYRAIYLPFNEVVAVKCLDLDRCNCNLDDVRREAQTMSLIDHPNVVRAYCSFVVEHDLWVIMPFMAEGSCLHLMKIAHPDGFDEAAICTILKETLKALQYLHKDGHIHRDVKAGNILLDNKGIIKLADFGVTACMFDKGDRQRSRKTFVGTPCWMAPEVLQPDSGYDFKADIWSFGITALELAHGHAPFSKYPPMKVLMMTIQYAPPGLDYDRDKKFSKSFKEMVAMCLVKDPKKRPTVEKLLKHSFFKHAKPPELSVKKLFADLPPLWDRVKAIQIKDAASLALKKMPTAEEEALSQSEYKRGVSAWNFDIEDLKMQASVIQDDDEISEIREGDESVKSVHSKKDAPYHGSCSDKSLSTNENVSSGQLDNNSLLQTKLSDSNGKSVESELRDPGSQGNNLKMKYGSGIELGSITTEKEAGQMVNRSQTTKGRQSQSGPLMPGIGLGASSSEKASSLERSGNGSLPTAGKGTRDMRKAPSFSGLLMLPNRASSSFEERSKMISNLISLPSLAIVLGVIYITLRAIYNVFFHPLRKFPGPLTHKITSMVTGYHDYRRSIIYHLRDLHEKYGAVVRVNPNELSYIDEKAWADIYGHRTPAGTGDLPKDRRTERVDPKNVSQIINANDVDHRRFRRVLSPLFSEKSISALEPIMTDYTNLLISQLRERAGGSVNIVDWYNFITFDILGDLAFGKSFGCLESGKINVWIETISLYFKDLCNWSASRKFPWPLNNIIYSLTPKNVKTAINERAILRSQTVQQRIEKDSSQEKPDFMSQMMKHNDEKGMTMPEIETNAGILIIAGSETTATLLSGLTYFLLTNREHLEKLTKLIRTTFESPKDIKALALHQLEYLSAIIDESLRLYPPAAVTLPRMAKKGGSVICGEAIPEYTTVGIPHFTAFRSPRNWADPEKFVPERWYKDDRCPERYRNDRRKVFQPFSYGPRNCVGKNMSTIEMRLIVAHILWNFDMELEPDSQDWINQTTSTLWEKGPMNVRLNVRKE